MLLTGIQGTGKSTLAQVLLHEFNVDRSDTLRINASQQNGIDVVRRLDTWCQAYPNGDYKVVILEEAERLSFAAQKGILDTIEKYDDTVKFILTSNSTSQLQPALLSRLQQVTFDTFNEEGIIGYLVDILVAEDIIVQEEETLFEHINAYKPDVRKIVNSIEQSSVTGTLRGVIAGGEGSSLEDDWKAIWEGDPSYDQCYPYLTQVNEANVVGLLQVMYQNFSNLPQENHYSAISSIAQGLERVSLGFADMEILLHATLIEVFGVND